MKRTAVAVVGLLASAAPGDPLYRWTDAAGNVHYNDSLHEVPEAQRKHAVKLGADPEADAAVVIHTKKARPAAKPVANPPPQGEAPDVTEGPEVQEPRKGR